MRIGLCVCPQRLHTARFYGEKCRSVYRDRDSYRNRDCPGRGEFQRGKQCWQHL